MPLLERLPVDTEIPPEARESFMDQFLIRVAEALESQITWALGGCVMLFLIVRGGLGAFTRARVRKARARQLLALEEEAAVLLELQKMRLARQDRQGGAA